MIVIDRIRIAGFRRIRRLDMPLRSPTVLIGSNNVGKTTVLKALQLALSEEFEASPHDFHRDRDGIAAPEIVIDVRFVPVSETGKRLSHFEPTWAKALTPHIASDSRGRDFFAFRTRLSRHDKNIPDKERFTLRSWDNPRKTRPLPLLPSVIRMVMLESDDDLPSAMGRPNSFFNLALDTLREELLAHPQYIHTPVDELRTELNRVSEALEGSGSVIPKNLTLNPATIGRFFDWLRRSDTPDRLDSLLGRGSQKTMMILSTVTLLKGLLGQASAHQAPLFILIAVEEPESHLHPNAQRTLMRLLDTLGSQLLVSTHSPFVVSSFPPLSLRALSRKEDEIDIRWLPKKMDKGDVRTLQRMILRFRGEVLFARGLLFVEGITEEQLLRGMFRAYFGDDPSAFGITIVGVEGKSYAPFFLLALSLRKPFAVVSDNDGDTAHAVLKQLVAAERKTHFTRSENRSDVFFLSEGLAIEGELVEKLDIRMELIDALIACNRVRNTSPESRKSQRARYLALTKSELRRKLERKKSEYSGFLGDIIEKNPYERTVEGLLPEAVRKAFAIIKTWI